MVSQDLFLFNTTVRENILYSRPGASDAEVIAATRKAQIHDEILALSEGGYETVVGERGGAQLSVGQRQRIAIARAFLKDVPILIMDEPTSALDEQTEQAIIPVLKNLSTSRTSILISHRPSLLGIADHVYAIQDGEILKK